MLTRDIFSIDPVEIQKVEVRLTIVDGRVVYEKKVTSDLGVTSDCEG
ncbi:MAG: hypothetical protein WKF30_09985 [Pyrinomonadaceae bacterium]